MESFTPWAVISVVKDSISKKGFDLEPITIDYYSGDNFSIF